MKRIEDYKTVEIWIKKACGSENTIPRYLGIFRDFLEYCEENPDEIIKEWKAVRYDWKERQRFIDKWTEEIENFYILLEDASKTKHNKAYVAISFFKHHKIPIDDVDIPKNSYITYHNRDMTKEEIRKVLEHSGLRERTFDLMMSESGLRPNTLVQLKYRDIREDFEANRIPMKINIRPEILKDRIEGRFTFIGIDAFNSLKEYLSTRNIGDDDYIFQKKSSRYNTEYICPEAFSTYFSRIIRKIGLRDIETEYGKPKRIRLYCLRKYFRNNMKIQDTNFREFWMCHRFDSDEHYITLDTEKHREEYTKGYEYLRIYENNGNIIDKEQIEVNKALQKQIREDRDRIAELENLVKTIAKERNIKRITAYETDTELETTRLVS